MAKKKVLLAAVLSLTMTFNSMSMNVFAETDGTKPESVNEMDSMTEEGQENTDPVTQSGEVEEIQEEAEGSLSEETEISEGGAEASTEAGLEVADEDLGEADTPAQERMSEETEPKTINEVEGQEAAEVSNGLNLTTDWEYTKEDGVILLSKYKGTSSDVIVPSEFADNPGVKVKLKDESVFGAPGSKGTNVLNSNITSIKIGTNPNNKIGIVSDSMRYMFASEAKNKPSNLTTVDFSCFDTSNVTNMERLFNYGSNLKSIDFTGFNTSNVTTMLAMFQHCTALENLDLSSFDTGSVTTMRGMFINCESLKSVDVSSFDISNVTTMMQMFQGCTSLQTLDMSGLNTDSALSMEATFLSCESLQSLNLEGFKADNIISTYGTFRGCKKLETVDLSGFSTSNATNMSQMFYECTALKSIQFGENFDTSSVTDMSHMFYKCNSLEELGLSFFDTSSVTTMESMFQGDIQKADKLERLDISSFNTSNVTNMSFMFSSRDELVSLDISSFDTSRVTTMEQMICDLPNLKSLNLGSMVIPSGISTRNLFTNIFTNSKEAIVFVTDDTVKKKVGEAISSKQPYTAKVVYNGNGGDFGTNVTTEEWTITGDKTIYDDETELQSVYQKSAEDISAQYTPERDGQLFDGWYLNADCTTPLDSTAVIDFTLPENKELQLYAGWKAAPLLVEDGMPGTDWTYRKGILTIVKDGNYKIIGDGNPTSDRIIVEPGFHGQITLSNVNIDVSNEWDTAAMFLRERIDDKSEVLPAEIEICLEGENSLKSGWAWAGITYNNGTDETRLTISGDGSLYAGGGAGASGIGTSNGQKKNNLTIKGGNITTNGRICADVIIDGGIIDSDIEGECTITGGSVDGSISGDAIISGGYITGEISGKVTNPDGDDLVKTEIRLDSADVTEISIDGVDQRITSVFGNDTIYVYVTEKEHELDVVDSTGATTEYVVRVKADGTTEALRDNQWVSELQLDTDNISYGETLNKNAEALYGNEQLYYMYSDKEQGTYTKEAPKNVGIYWIKAVVDETDSYTGLESTPVMFEIKKAIPTPDEITGLVIGQGKTLDTIELPEGFAWADGTQILDVLGTHEFKAVYTPADTANYETVEVTIKVEVVPNLTELNHVPTIDAEDKTITVGDRFEVLEGVTASDQEDKDITSKIEIVNNTVDTSKAGTYEVTYKVTDSQGASVTKTIHVIVNPKMMELNHVPTIDTGDKTITVGDKFEALEGVTASDQEDKDITSKIEIVSNTVDTSKAGTYKITYKVTDSAGASVEKTITVTVKPKKTEDITKPEDTTDTVKPESTTEPEDTTNTEKPEEHKDTDPVKSGASPATGDTANIGLLLSMFAGSLVILAAMLGKRRKKNKE